MERKDFRSLGRDAMEALRVRAVYLVLQLHKTQAQAAEAVGASRQTVNQWLHNHATMGEQALLDRRRISSRKGQGLLTPAEIRRVQRWIMDKCPDQLKLPGMLWTAGVVRELIRRRLGKRLGLSTVQLYLLRWGITPQKPLSRATQRADLAIQRWQEREYPKIARRAKREKGLIYWGGETGVSNQDQVGRRYAPKGQTAVVHRTAKKISRSMISAVNNRGLMRFMCFQGALNAGLFIAFLGRHIKDAPGKIFLIVDSLRVHKAVKVSQWVTAHKDAIELFFLPPYAPEHNPDES
jgi:transposase